MHPPADEDAQQCQCTMIVYAKSRADGEEVLLARFCEMQGFLCKMYLSSCRKMVQLAGPLLLYGASARHPEFDALGCLAPAIDVDTVRLQHATL